MKAAGMPGQIVVNRSVLKRTSLWGHWV